MNGLKKANVGLDRKAIAEMAVNEPVSFRFLVQESKAALAR
jgi:large subunit ribosomal protein L20